MDHLVRLSKWWALGERTGALLSGHLGTGSKWWTLDDLFPLFPYLGARSLLESGSKF